MQNASNCILVHNTLTQYFDIEIVQKQPIATQFYFCLCVIANEYINNDSPNLQTLFNNIQNIVVGTDSLASNTNLNILHELQVIAALCKNISVEKLLQCATLNGAKALGIDKHFGSFEKGKKCGVILIENFTHSKRPIILA
jgi:cytosine/adenosine deaminase-related metal-dependent hydrolase